tara:strand:+ start:106 stop:1020 length:915 start_codon:yes stop_codon:yes gene_type:complete
MAITLGGAGGGSEINDNKVINSTASLITTASGEKWLQSGTVSTATSTYPNATNALSAMTLGSVAHSTSSQINNPRGLLWDGSYFWAVATNSPRGIYKYNANGTYANVYIALSNVNLNVYDLTTDGTNIYVVSQATNGSDEQVTQHTMAGVATGTSFQIQTGTGSFTRGIAYFDNHFYIIDQDSGGSYTQSIQKLTMAGVYVSTLATGLNQTQSPWAFMYHEGEFLLAENNGRVYVYTLAGAYTGKVFNLNPGLDNLKGLTYDGTKFWGISSSTNSFKDIIPTNSLGIATKRTEYSGGVVYTRIL